MKNVYPRSTRAMFLLLILFSYLGVLAQGSPTLITNTLKTTCPANTANLNAALHQPPTPGYQIHWYTTSNRASGTLVTSPTAVGAGTYYAFVYNNDGSYSPPSVALTVQTQTCTGITTAASTPCNQIMPLTTQYFTGVTSSTNAWGLSTTELTNSNINDYLSYTPILLSNRKYSVKSNVEFPSGTYAGFNISKSAALDLSVAPSISINLKKGGVEVQSKVVFSSALSTSDLLLSSNGRNNLGFISNVAFDEVEIEISSVLSVTLGSFNIYHAVVGNMCSSPALVPNNLTSLNQNIFPTIVKTAKSGTCVGCTISNSDAVISPNREDYATVQMTLDLGAQYSLSVENTKETYNAGTFAGFTIENRSSLLNANVAQNITIKTYLDGTLQETSSSSNLLGLGSNLLNRPGRKTIGIFTTKQFDQVEITIASLADLATETRIYEAVAMTFAAGPSLNCNELTALTNPQFPVMINPARTGVQGVACVACDVTDEMNVINNYTDDYATLKTTVGIATKSQLSVKNQVGQFTAGTFAGFEIQSTSPLDLDLLNGITLVTYKNNLVQDSLSGTNNLLALNLLTNLASGRNIVGFNTTKDFDEIKIAYQATLGADLGELRVYKVVVNNFCEASKLVCFENKYLTSPSYPLYINMANTGNSGLLTTATLVNVNNFINADTTDYVTLTIPVGLATGTSLATKLAKGVFPKGSTAGVTFVDPNNMLQATLLSNVKLELFRNGSLVATATTANSLLEVDVLTLLSGLKEYRIKVKAPDQYDEIKITFNSFLDAVKIMYIYGAFIQTRGSNDPVYDLVCCTVEDYKLTLKTSLEMNDCPEDVVNLNNNLASLCPSGGAIQWYTTNSVIADSLVANPTSVKEGTYYAVCYDAEMSCYGIFSDPVKIELAECCPTIDVTTTNPTACNLNDGILTISGLSPGVNNYTVKYEVGGNTITRDSVEADANGEIIIYNLPAGTYENIMVSNEACPTGVSVASAVLSDPTPPAVPTLTASNASICIGSTVNLEATCAAGTTLRWYSDSGLTNEVSTQQQPAASTTYYAVCTVNNCVSSTASFAVTVTPFNAAPTLTSTPPSIVVGSSATLSATCTSGTVYWYSDESRQTPLANTTVSPTATTTYYAACGEGACSALAQITVIVRDKLADLALEINRHTNQSATVAHGDTVTFTILVTNEGDFDATNIGIINYAPAGLTFIPELNPDWTASGGHHEINVSSLQMGQTITLTVKYKVDSNASGSITNSAEIFQANFGSGIVNVDYDSVYDKNNTNDKTNGIITDDDYDEVSVWVCPTGNCSTARYKRTQ